MARRDTPSVSALRDNIIKLFPDQDADLPETPLGAAPEAAAEQPSDPAQVLDLTGKHRVIMAFGPGRSGKSTLIRWMVDRALSRNDGEPRALASLDTRRQTLKLFYPDTMMPDSAEPKVVQAWLERVLLRAIDRKVQMVIDFGADMTLPPILGEAMRDTGTEPVVFCMLTPRQSDLTVLDSMDRLGFRPPATALVRNLGTADTQAEFGQIRRHSVYKAAVARGATEIWMPRLYNAAAVEDRGVTFTQALTGQGLDEKLRLNVFDHRRVADWRSQMETAFAPVASWLL